MTGSVLPSNATRREKAIEAASIDRWDRIDPGLIQASKDPMRAPAHLLPFLAFDLGLDVWDENWPEWKKRAVIARSIELHRKKGTLAGLKSYAELADSKIIRAVLPPGTFLLSGGPTKAELEEIKRLMPQVRFYQRAGRYSARRTLFFGAGRYSLLSRQFLTDGQAGQRARPKIVFADRGEETPIELEQVSQILPYLGRVVFQRFSLPMKRKRGVSYFGKRPLRFLTKLENNNRVASFRRVAGADSMMRPGLLPASIEPEMVYPAGHGGRAYFNGKRPLGHFLGGANAALRVYERVVFWDASRLSSRRKASYLGVSRFGVPAYTAELQVDIPNRWFRRSLVLRHSFLGDFLVRYPDEHYRLTFQALRSAKAQRDKIDINTDIYRSPTAGTLIAAGTPFIAGRLLRS